MFESELIDKYYSKEDICCRCGTHLIDHCGCGLGYTFIMDWEGRFYCTECDHDFEQGDERIFEPDLAEQPNTAVMVAIRPEWVEFIVNDLKLWEFRKTVPRISTPFKCYIYETKHIFEPSLFYSKFPCQGTGKVIGEFVCDKIDRVGENDSEHLKDGRITIERLRAYAAGKPLYAWHITNLIVYDYDDRKNITDFCRPCDKPRGTDCTLCKENGKACCNYLTRPPQSWCYVQEI